MTRVKETSLSIGFTRADCAALDPMIKLASAGNRLSPVCNSFFGSLHALCSMCLGKTVACSFFAEF
jgi:hypothetical protein